MLPTAEFIDARSPARQLANQPRLLSCPVNDNETLLFFRHVMANAKSLGKALFPCKGLKEIHSSILAKKDAFVP